SGFGTYTFVGIFESNQDVREQCLIIDSLLLCHDDVLDNSSASVQSISLGKDRMLSRPDGSKERNGVRISDLALGEEFKVEKVFEILFRWDSGSERREQCVEFAVVCVSQEADNGRALGDLGNKILIVGASLDNLLLLWCLLFARLDLKRLDDSAELQLQNLNVNLFILQDLMEESGKLLLVGLAGNLSFSQSNNNFPKVGADVFLHGDIAVSGDRNQLRKYLLLLVDTQSDISKNRFCDLEGAKFLVGNFVKDSQYNAGS